MSLVYRYDQDNVFAKIIKGDILVDKLYEDEKLIAIHDINPVAYVHILVIPKGQYLDFAEFVAKSSVEDVAHYFKIIDKVAKANGAKEYRLVTNKGESTGQSVFHFHTHILSGFHRKELINKDYE